MLTDSVKIAQEKAAELSTKHAGVVACGRCPHPETDELGEGELVVLARFGEVPDLE